MLELTYRTKDARLSLKVQGETLKELFRTMATAQELFADSQCGLCHSEDIKFRVRQADTYEFFEKVCAACNGVLAYGQRRDGSGLFPRRKSEAGELLPNGGWLKWTKETQ
jgi:hypothetical protein